MKRQLSSGGATSLNLELETTCGQCREVVYFGASSEESEHSPHRQTFTSDMNLGLRNHSPVSLNYEVGASLEAMGINQRILESHSSNGPLCKCLQLLSSR